MQDEAAAASSSSDGSSTASTVDAARPQLNQAAGLPAGRPPPGATWPCIAGYEILDELGHGGMGVVYKVRQAAPNRLCALKMVRGYVSRVDLVRFTREAELAAGLHHAHIAHIYEVGSVDGQPYYTMEYLEGGTLAGRAGGPMPPREAAELVESLARAVGFANARGIVHRDLKPANVLFDHEGCPKVADFGIAKQLEEGATLTESGAVVGTPAYMAPEQARGDTRGIGPATDVYALGAILYELLTGRPPFIPEDSDVHLAHRILTEDPISPAWHRPGTPPDLEAICLKCLQKNPKDRYESATALAEDLRHFLADEAVTARRPGRVRRGVKWAKRHPARTLAWTACTLLVVAGSWALGYAYAYRWDRVEYYANFTTRWGTFEGIGRLTPEQAHHRRTILKAHRRGRWGRVTSIQVLTGHETFIDDLAPLATWMRGYDGGRIGLPALQAEFTFNDAGYVAQETGRTASGRVPYRFRYEYSADEPAADPRRRVYGRFYSETPYDLASEFGASIVRLERGPDGFDRRASFFDAKGQPRRNGEGVYGMALEHDAVGNVTRATYLDAEGNPMKSNAGITCRVTVPDAMGNPLRLSFLGPGGRPTINRLGVACYASEWDRSGNLIHLIALGTDGQPVVGRGGGWCAQAIQYDERGNDTEVRYFDTRNQLAPSDQLGTAVRESKYDERGNKTDEFDHDKNGKFIDHFYYEYDANNRQTKLAHFDEKGRQQSMSMTFEYNPRGSQTAKVVWSGGKVRQRTERRYDEQERPVSEEYVDGAGQPKRGAEGYTGVTIVYGPGDGVTTTTYRGFDVAATGYATMTRLTNLETSVVEDTLLDAQGQRVMGRDGYSRQVARRDSEGNMAEVSYFDDADRPARTLGGYGYSHAVATYDAKNVQTGTVYDGVDPARRGFEAMQYVFDARGMKAEDRVLTRNHQPAMCRDGYARAVYERDAEGEVKRVRLFDLDGKASDAELYVLAALPGNEGARAGVQAGDVAVSFDSRPLRDWDALPTELPAPSNAASTRPDGSSRELVILRHGEVQRISLRSGRLGLILAYRPSVTASSQPTTQGSVSLPSDKSAEP